MSEAERFSELLQVRAPVRLMQALETEAQRRMIAKSALVRLTLAEQLGLTEGEPQDKTQSAK
jgi:hypothetical protein